jgi:hypothetical protein
MHGKEERDMNNFKTKLLALALVLATALSSAPLAVQAAVSVPSDEIYYLTSKSKDDTSYCYIYIDGLSKSSEVTKMKSSKESVVSLDSYQKYSYVSTTSYNYMNSEEENSSYTNKSYSASIGFAVNKAGTSDITYTIGKKSYTTKVTVKDYTNPLKTVEISGLKNGKSTNLKGLVDSSAYASGLKLKSDQKDAKIKFAAKKGWMITSAYVIDNDGYDVLESISYSRGISSVTLNPGTLKKDGTYQTYVDLYNVENGGTLNVCFFIND